MQVIVDTVDVVRWLEGQRRRKYHQQVVSNSHGRLVDPLTHRGALISYYYQIIIALTYLFLVLMTH